MMKSPRRHDQPLRGFTLVELLVVLAIIALISVAALRGGLLNARSDYKAGEASRELQAAIAGTRDAAIRANAPRGIRLLPDPILSPPPYGRNTAGILTSNRWVTIEPAPDYSEGQVVANPAPTGPAFFLSVDQSPLQSLGGVTIPTEPTGWFYNIRQGDKIRFNDSGAYYTVAGPMVVGPSYTGASTLQNAERYVNGPLATLHGGTVSATNPLVEYLYLVNGVDDDKDGWVDEGFDGIDNDGDGIVDPGFNGVDDNKDGVVDDPAELLIGNEFETEAFLGNPPSTTLSSNYTIMRRPIVSPGTREVTLPDGMVIDMTTWNAAASTPLSVINSTTPHGPIQFPERSRLPVDPYSYYVDIMVAPSGQVIQAGAGAAGIEYNSTTPTSNLPFYHFWLTEREGVVAPIFGQDTRFATNNNGAYRPILNPNYSSNPSQNYLLPMPQATVNYLPMPIPYAQSPVYLTGERRLVTLFTRSGQIVTNMLETFDGNDINRPFYDAQAGIKESQ